MESWNQNFKVETIHREWLQTRSDAKQHVFGYTRKQIHSKLGYLACESFELKRVSHQSACEKQVEILSDFRGVWTEFGGRKVVDAYR